MTFGRFLKDKRSYVTGIAAASIFAYLILDLVHCPLLVILLVIAVFCLSGFIPLLKEFMAKRRYYQELLTNLAELQEKYYIASITKQPSFLDGFIGWEVLNTAARSMNETIAALERDNQQYREYVELWVHEIKTPISGIKLICENKSYTDVSEELERIERYVEQSLYYARSHSVENDYLIKETQIAELIRNFVKTKARYFIANKIRIEICGDGTVFSDPKWLFFILGQLADNSVKYGAKMICFSFSKGILCVSDDGIGIPAEDLPRVLERGFSGRNGRNTSTSTGMGLYLCKMLCDKLGLKLSVTSNQGTNIWISFPEHPFTTLI